MVQQSLAGLKEIEVLVMRDSSGTMMNLAMVENLDPIGIHAGDSVAVTPAQTLMDREIQDIRNVAFAITRAPAHRRGQPRSVCPRPGAPTLLRD
ncbi:ATP-binding protein [Limosilactobacillus fermentum]